MEDKKEIRLALIVSFILINILIGLQDNFSYIAFFAGQLFAGFVCLVWRLNSEH